MSESDSEDENHIRYGTPLDAYDEDDVPSKKMPGHVVSDQFAYDDHGRRRFHGAFTGGFTAGYGNTVAAPEGWSPSTFRSSRSEKAQQSAQKPEDFMDEEDRGQFGIAPKEINTTKDFSSNKRKHPRNELRNGPIPGIPVLEALLQPAHDTVAVRILKSMGWKPGQGVGERLTAKEKKIKIMTSKRVYGCYVPEEFRQAQSSEEKLNKEGDSASDLSEDEFSEILFAPDDFEPFVQRPKNDLFGLGYEGMSRRSVLGSIAGRYGSEAGDGPSSHLFLQDKGKRVSIRGQAFGVGALEEEDEDIYAKEDMSNYDFTLGGEAKKKDKLQIASKNGHVLEGFVCVTKPALVQNKYYSPVLPKDYKPGVGGIRKSRFGPVDERLESNQVPVRDRGLGRHDLTASERGQLLGERDCELRAAVPSKVTNDVPVKDGARKQTPDELIAAITGRNISFVGNSNAGEDPKGKKSDDVDPDPAVFRPFSSDPGKQARYEGFLRGNDASTESLPRDHLSQWERQRELKEFEQAARLYKPLAGTMGDRFVHPSDAEGASIDPMSSISRSGSRSGVTQQQMDAASKRMYGKLTRVEKEWRPESILCKRFNVPDPFGQRPTEMSKAAKKQTQYSIFEFLEAPLHNKESFLRDQAAFSGVNQTPAVHKNKENRESAEVASSVNKVIVAPPKLNSKRMTVAELFLMEKEKEKTDKMRSDSRETVGESPATDANDVAEDAIEKFDKIDLYKAIFLSDSSGDDADDVREKSDDLVATAASDARNDSPPRGIFANLDFDQLNSWRTRAAEADRRPPEPHADGAEAPEEAYGPKLPEGPSLARRVAPDVSNDVLSVSSSSGSDSWVDSEELDKAKEKALKHKRSKKGKKSHREKYRRHKHKGKSKKHKR